ncbi:MAG: permease-like cell division protein FtsX [Gammaproteobacteria bacterium]|nr:permease-like cell division protein FtsX [Gammaproteobacteria bacterium]MCB1923908.1 permease-like cell division protein FtsX [Gammaproteobacteria bacterium]
MAKRTRQPGFKRNRNPVTWLLRHAQMSLSSLGRLSRSPLTTLMTATVIGIALALPSGLHLIVDNVRQLSSSWDGSASISLFLNQSVSDEQAEQVRATVAKRTDVAESRLISRSAALDEFRRLSGFGQAIELLDHNPLPPVVLVRPAATVQDADAVGRLAQELQAYREIDLAQVDLQWVERLGAITGTIERAVLILAALLAGAVLLIVGNTIRLEIQNRHSEIEIVKLVGGTDAFIRRPFLYEGLWYGLLGGAIALLLVLASLYLLDGPVERLAGLYESGFSLSVLDPLSLFGVLLGGPALGLTGAWLAVGRHLAEIQPE